MRVRRPGSAWEVALQRHPQGSKGGGRWFTASSTDLRSALIEAAGDALDTYQVDIACLYLENVWLPRIEADRKARGASGDHPANARSGAEPERV